MIIRSLKKFTKYAENIFRKINVLHVEEDI